MAWDRVSSLNGVVGQTPVRPQEKIIDLTLSDGEPAKMAVYYDSKGNMEAANIIIGLVNLGESIICELKRVENKLQIVDIYYFNRNFPGDKQLSEEFVNELKDRVSSAVASILSEKEISLSVQEILISVSNKVKFMKNIESKGKFERISLSMISDKKAAIDMKRELDLEGRLTKDIRFEIYPIKGKSFLFEAVEKGNSFIVKGSSIIEKDCLFFKVHRTKLNENEAEEIKPILMRMIVESDDLAIREILTDIIKRL